MSHLTPDELVDAIDGTLDAAQRAHVEGCALCRAEVAHLAALLVTTRDATIPEPSPLFWDHLSARVRSAIEVEEIPRRGWAPQWARFAVLAPVAALAVLVIVLGSAVGKKPGAAMAITTVQPSVPNDAAASGDEEWAAIAAILAPADIEAAQEAGMLVRPGDVERAALELSAAEQRRLVELVKTEIERAGG